MTTPLSDIEFTEMVGRAFTWGLAPGELVRLLEYAYWQSMEFKDVKAKLKEKDTEINKLREALMELMAWQNGPPLIRDEKGWTAAMEKANTVLAGTAPKPDASD